MTRRATSRKAKNGICRVYWGSHGCGKPHGHLGRHRCGNGCAYPDGYELYGEDILDTDPLMDEVLRVERYKHPVAP